MGSPLREFLRFTSLHHMRFLLLFRPSQPLFHHQQLTPSLVLSPHRRFAPLHHPLYPLATRGGHPCQSHDLGMMQSAKQAYARTCTALYAGAAP